MRPRKILLAFLVTIGYSLVIVAWVQRVGRPPLSRYGSNHLKRLPVLRHTVPRTQAAGMSMALLVDASAPPTPTDLSESSSLQNRPTLNVFERISRAVNFYSAAIPVFASYKLLSMSLSLNREVLGQNVTLEEEALKYDALHDWGSDIIYDKIAELKGFYVKTGQIISTRVDIFPEQYTSKLAVMQDALDPISAEVIKKVVRDDLLNGASLDELFLEFDDEPLGSASIAQVHRARLLDGRVVAVKVQRPGIEAKLLGDITNLKSFAKIVSDALPIDYYKIFCELEKTLVYELDFLHEAQATIKVAAAVAHSPDNKPVTAPLVVPLPISGLCSRNVIVMEFVDGVALSKLAKQMTAKGIKPGSPESQLFGRKLLGALTDAYSNMIFGSGIIHGDPHPGNIFVLNGGMGEVALLDCGQVKQCSTAQRLALAKLILMVNEWEKKAEQLGAFPAAERATDATAVAITDRMDELKRSMSKLVQSFGVAFKPDVKNLDDCAAALVVLLFGSTGTKLPGGYAGEEISKDSPILQIAEFPQELVLLGRATVMIKGIANRLGVKWGLSDRWAVAGRMALATVNNPSEFLPIWSVAQPSLPTTASSASVNSATKRGGNKVVRFGDIVQSVGAVFAVSVAYLRYKVLNFIKTHVTEAQARQLLGMYLRLTKFVENVQDRWKKITNRGPAKA